MNQVFIYIFFISFILAVMPPAHAKTSQNKVDLLKIGTMDLPPYGWQDSKHIKHGIIYELNQEIGTRSGIKFTNEILPFKRMLMMLKKGKLDLVSSQAHKASLDAGDKLAIQFNINVIGGTKKGSKIKTIKDFKNRHLVYHRAASYVQLEGLPSKISRANSYKQILGMIHTLPLVDGGVFSEPAYYYWMQNLGLSPKDFGKVVMIEVGKEQWIFVRKDLPKKLRRKLSKIVTDIYQEKMYDRLLKKYGKH